MSDAENDVEITKPETRTVVPASPQEELKSGTPVKVHNPALISQSAPMPTTCAKCGAPVHRTPSSVPFKGGSHPGGFLCRECWVLEWAESPDVAADAPTRKWIAEEATRIKVRRAGGSSTIYKDGVNSVYLTKRGTILIDLARLPFVGPDEYDPARVQTLIKLFKAVSEKLPQFATEAKLVPPKEPPPAPPKA